jgi:hypothetical protein
LCPSIDGINNNELQTQTHTKEHTMLDFTNLLAVLGRIFTDRSYGQTLESYITSRNPQNEIDIERFTREFQMKTGSALW